MIREDREDTAAQEKAYSDARAQLAADLERLAWTAKSAAKAAGSRRGAPDLPAVTAAFRAVQRAEEACDMAALDVQTARGEHA